MNKWLYHSFSLQSFRQTNCYNIQIYKTSQGKEMINMEHYFSIWVKNGMKLPWKEIINITNVVNKKLTTSLNELTRINNNYLIKN